MHVDSIPNLMDGNAIWMIMLLVMAYFFNIKSILKLIMSM